MTGIVTQTTGFP